MSIDLILPISFLFSFTAYGLIARWYALPALRTLSKESALIILALPHTFRYIGLTFLIPGVTAAPLNPSFSQPAAYGDLLAAVLAFVAIFSLRSKASWSGAATWLFNIVGTIDLITAVSIGTFVNQTTSMGATFYIPAVIVPFLLVSHALIFIVQTRTKVIAR